ncbi:MAG: GGDEF domain-containing protein [Myxococcales bacterium FL481]|nr:MAG: GGDEF domain-containing protein [Myxococcales bacterium FL481]
MGTQVSVPGQRPPVVQFALHVLEARDRQALLQRCVEDFVALFAVASAQVVDDDGETLAQCATDAGDLGPLVHWRFRLSRRDDERLEMRIALAQTEDLFIIRQQFIDLMAVVRGGLNHHRVVEQREREAHQDELTGLENRRSIARCLQEEVERCSADGSSLCVMLVDLDGFKEVNDEHGHLAGDGVLRAAAEVMRQHLRARDRVARWGGDEFLAVFPGLEADQVLPLADRLRAAFAEDSRAQGTTMSIGIADTAMARATGSLTLETLVARADELLYQSKRGGRNRVASRMSSSLRDVG